MSILYHDWLGVKKLLARAKAICEAGGDWEHKNKLKVGSGCLSLALSLVAVSAWLLYLVIKSLQLCNTCTVQRVLSTA